MLGEESFFVSDKHISTPATAKYAITPEFYHFFGGVTHNHNFRANMTPQRLLFSIWPPALSSFIYWEKKVFQDKVVFLRQTWKRDFIWLHHFLRQTLVTQHIKNIFMPENVVVKQKLWDAWRRLYLKRKNRAKTFSHHEPFSFVGLQKSGLENINLL